MASFAPPPPPTTVLQCMNAHCLLVHFFFFLICRILILAVIRDVRVQINLIFVKVHLSILTCIENHAFSGIFNMFSISPTDTLTFLRYYCLDRCFFFFFLQGICLHII